MCVEAIYVDTGIQDKIGYIIIESVLSHLECGIWGCSDFSKNYLNFCEVFFDRSHQVTLSILNKEKIFRNTVRYNTGMTLYKGKFVENYFITKLNSNPRKIKRFFADKIKQIVLDEKHEDPDAGIEFSPKCKVRLGYISDEPEYGVTVTAADAYRVYKKLYE